MQEVERRREAGGRSKQRTCQLAIGQDVLTDSALPCLPSRLSVNKREVVFTSTCGRRLSASSDNASVGSAVLRYHGQVPASVARSRHCVDIALTLQPVHTLPVATDRSDDADTSLVLKDLQLVGYS